MAGGCCGWGSNAIINDARTFVEAEVITDWPKRKRKKTSERENSYLVLQFLQICSFLFKPVSQSYAF